MSRSYQILDRVILNPETLEAGYKYPVAEHATTRMTFCYLHGNAEKDNGFDCFGVVNEVPQYAGIYPATIMHNPKPCTFFLWNTTGDHQHGLVVYNDDEQAYKDAEEKYHRRAISI